jgi:hypothetical protein
MKRIYLYFAVLMTAIVSVPVASAPAQDAYSYALFMCFERYGEL